ncbi:MULTISPECIES: Ig-like domain repeat protein [Mumia]|nr:MULTISPECIES: Ig-like domain repeat protein [Mumia]
MSPRPLTAVGVAALSAALVLGTPLAASADPTSTPAATDIVGVGSDTTQFVLGYLANGTTVNGTVLKGYNEGRATGKLASFDAIKADGTTGDPIVLKTGAASIARPNGSSAGKGLLYGASPNANVNYARSSSSLSDPEKAANLYQIPFAIDGIKLAVRKAGSNAPAAISGADVVKIYNGTYTNWNQLGGAAGVIKPLIPQSGSGTRSVFEGQLKALNGGVAVVLAPGVAETQEHSDADVKNDANAIVPFSTGRAKVTPTITLSGGWSFTRALYNVVRVTDLGSPWAAGIFLENGFACSAAAKPLIEAAGFEQLATPAKGGVCGEPTQDATSNFTTSADTPAKVASTTSVAVPGAASYGKTRTVVATVRRGGAAATGSVVVKVGSRPAQTVALSGGRASVTLPASLGAGAYAVTASFGGNATTAASKTQGVLRVTKASSKVGFTISPKKLTAKKRAKAAVKVSLPGLPASIRPSGRVLVLDGKKVVGRGTVSAKGTVTVKLAKLKKGKHKLKVTYAGNGNVFASTSKVIKVRVR